MFWRHPTQYYLAIYVENIITGLITKNTELFYMDFTKFIVYKMYVKEFTISVL